jgi:hypothetical protein
MPRSVDWQPSFNLGTDTGTAEEDVHRLFLSHSAVTPFRRSISPTDTGPGEHMIFGYGYGYCRRRRPSTLSFPFRRHAIQTKHLAD